jgi:hypothetical protein
MCSVTLLTEKHHPPTWRASPSDFRFTYFGSAAFAVRLLPLDQKLIDGVPMNPGARRTCSTPSRSCCGNSAAHLAKPGDETVVLYADGTAVEIPNF